MVTCYFCGGIFPAGSHTSCYEGKYQQEKITNLRDVVIPKATLISEDQIRQIVREELARASKESTKTPSAASSSQWNLLWEAINDWHEEKMELDRRRSDGQLINGANIAACREAANLVEKRVKDIVAACKDQK